jgi:uncharacterized protein
MATTSKSRIGTDIDFEKDGKQISYLRVPYSHDRSAHGAIHVPMAVIKNGRGKTIYFQAGCHGDEYEGQIALTKLIRELEPSDVNGRVIIIPAANLPAALAGKRCSPIDDGNLNRIFPGDPDGDPSEMIAHYIDSVVMPKVNVFQDLHSGGTTLRFTPFAQTRLAGANPQKEECIAALRAFGAPIGFVTYDNGEERIASFSAYKHGAIALSGEFGGGANVALDALGIVERGVRNILGHFGIIEKPKHEGEPTKPSRLMEAKDRTYNVWASDRGLFEPYYQLGDMVEAGKPAGAIHFIDNPKRPPVIEYFQQSGMVYGARVDGQCERGDALLYVCVEYRG